MKTFLIFAGLLLSVPTISQSKWHPYFGLHESMDAEGYYFGPSAQAGIDYRLKKRINLSSYIQYFPDRVDKLYSDLTFEDGKYYSIIVAVLSEFNLSKI